MDLPGDSTEIAENSTKSGSGSIDAEDGGTSPTTAAERFAHNQHTLKKRPVRETELKLVMFYFLYKCL